VIESISSPIDTSPSALLTSLDREEAQDQISYDVCLRVSSPIFSGWREVDGENGIESRCFKDN